ncbi:unnamed protein product [Rotaria sordida]|uniref:Uncharacterized protein n=1 Tax=Rotaria sordida TaxID=392033 RepID=A0A818T1G2_9BILA|nr:unnamed protein product [Rotaria sordida]CAF3677384.1 unnamed protein product [Rotaria sordida]CAF3682708.1 unnamed protein product [Rotaria sordida]
MNDSICLLHKSYLLQMPDICPCSDDIDICLCCIPLNLLCCCLPCCRPPRDRVVYVQAAQPMHPTRDHSYIIREPISR